MCIQKRTLQAKWKILVQLWGVLNFLVDTSYFPLYYNIYITIISEPRSNDQIFQNFLEQHFKFDPFFLELLSIIGVVIAAW